MYVETETGERIPAVPQFDDGVIRCPYGCEAETHTHGVTDEPLTHRVAHCAGGEHGRGYYLLRPLAGHFGGVPWWGSGPIPAPVKSRPGLTGLDIHRANPVQVAGFLEVARA